MLVHKTFEGFFFRISVLVMHLKIMKSVYNFKHYGWLYASYFAKYANLQINTEFGPTFAASNQTRLRRSDSKVIQVYWGHSQL